MSKNSQRKHNYDLVLPICRVCLKTSSDQCMSLFESHRDCSISQLICLIVDVKISKGDGYPDNICKRCLLDLEIALNFKERCENSNNVLMGLKNTQQVNPNQDYPPTKSHYDEVTPYYEDLPYNNEVIKSNDIPQDDPPNVEDSINNEDFINKRDTNVVDSINYLNISKFKDSITNKSVSYAVIKTNDEDTLRPSIKQSGEVQCHDCGEMFKTKCKLRVHWKKMHLLESQTCQLCKRAFKSFFAFKRHKKNPCLNPKFVFVEGVGKGRTYNCTKCSYSSKLIQSIIFHSVTHTGDKRYKCELCFKAFTQTKSLYRHCERIHEQYRTEMTCHYCGLFVQGSDKVYQHLKGHRNLKYQCDICKKFIKGKYNMVNHLKRHSGIKSFTCEVCAALFATSSDLANHKRNHHRVGPPPKKILYTCDMCGYQSYKNYMLNKHKLKHSESNHACGECGQFFDDASKLQKHLRVHFDEKKYSCPLCDAKFFHRDGRSRHLKYKHNPQIPKPQKHVKSALTR